MTRACTNDQKAVTALIKNIDQQYLDLAKLMEVMAEADAKAVQGRLAATDCTKFATAEAAVVHPPPTPAPSADEAADSSWDSVVVEKPGVKYIRLLRERAAREVLRKHRLTRCKHTKATLKARATSVKNEIRKVTMKW